MNLRGFGTKNLGLSPYGAPARLAFLTNCIRHLFEKSTANGLFFPLKAQKLSPILRSFS